MNGIHDMGGMDGFGRIEAEPNEPVFHEPWEGRVYALLFGGRLGRWDRDPERRNGPGLGRYGLETIPPADYLRMSYYERWFTMIVNYLLRSDLVTREELESGSANPGRPGPGPAQEPDEPSPEPSESLARPRFRPHQPVRARNVHPRGHTRLPRYVRGKIGVVLRDHGVFRLQDTDERGRRLSSGPPQHVYTVRFEGRELWGERASERDAVYVDLWEDYLEPT